MSFVTVSYPMMALRLGFTATIMAACSVITIQNVWAEKAATQTVAQSSAVALSPQDQTDVARIEKYLNELKMFSAGFLQVNDRGEMRHGKIYIQRPGKMRVVYDPPNADLIVADGTFVHMWDAEMGQQTNVLQGENLAEFILRDNISMNGDIRVTKLERFPAKLEITLVSVKDPEMGELTLILEDRPLRIRQWRVKDVQGRITGVNLENISNESSFPEGTFTFFPPDKLKPSQVVRPPRR